jgi:hypothetical protein
VSVIPFPCPFEGPQQPMREPAPFPTEPPTCRVPAPVTPTEAATRLLDILREADEILDRGDFVDMKAVVWTPVRQLATALLLSEPR